MTNEEIYDVLSDVYRVVDIAGKDKVKRIYRILFSNKKETSLCGGKYCGLVQHTKNILSDFMNQKNLVDIFDKKQIKSLYSILSEYQIYPICPLCGHAIKRYSNNKHPDEFSWDHITPKSLGGSSDIYNLQPTHKECNNRKGNDMLYHAHYNIEIIVNINFSVNMAKKDKRCHKKNLRKKDYLQHCKCGFCR